MSTEHKRDATAMTKALNANLSIPIKKELNLIKDSEEDYEVIRTNLKELMEKSSKSIDAMLALAEATEHPRAFEVLSAMLKTSSEISMELLAMHKARKALVAESGVPGAPAANGTNNTQNNFFVGSTTELQKLLKKKITDANTIPA